MKPPLAFIGLMILLGALLLSSASGLIPPITWMSDFGFPPNRHLLLGGLLVAGGVIGCVVLWGIGALSPTEGR